ncbi:hypothetical protein PSE10C_51560 [Pseudomonas amygdali pv. eriobotryae]|uniref:hypothetical protein n=1 Tax=Pseudomonas amygdali TaxID=47877 RepID=UPI0016795AC4|nr:hypothetical protein [Pseudomonas amygdali]GFZ74414.1 hypothetical protein PSE10C_51560 [Pseudomonas amygdali pv. eriobotryae]
MDFTLTYWTRRREGKTTLMVRKTETGWHISGETILGDTDPDGAQILEANLNQDHVTFPDSVGSFLGFVWKQLHCDEIDAERAQIMIYEIGDWITACERSQPEWNGYNS